MPAITIKTNDTTNVTRVGTGWLSQTGYYSTSQWYANNGDPAIYNQWRAQSLSPGTPYTIGGFYRFDISNRSTVSRYAVIDSDGVTVLATRHVNMRHVPDAFTFDGVAWRGLFNATPSGDTLYIRLYGDNGGTANYVIADGIFLQPWTDGIPGGIPFSVMSGNWNDPMTWAGGVIPGATTALTNLYNSVAANVNVTVGTSGTSGTYALAVKRETGQLLVNDAITFTSRGGILLAEKDVTVAKVQGRYPVQVGQGITGGAKLVIDSTLSSGAASLYKIEQSETAMPNAVLRVLGIDGNPAEVQSAEGGANASIGSGSFTTRTGQVVADHAIFRRIGNATTPAIKAILSGTGDELRLSNVSFIDCGNNTVAVSCSNSGTVLSITDTRIKSIVSSGTPNALTVNGTGTGSWEIRRCVLDGFVNFNHQGAYASASYEDNVYLKQITYNNATSSPAIDQGHFHFRDIDTDDAVLATLSGSNYRKSYFFAYYPGNVRGNPHGISPNGTLKLYECVCDYYGPQLADVGDFADNGNGTLELWNCIVLPSSAGHSAGAVWQFVTGSGSVKLNNCTFFLSDYDLSGLQTGHNIGATGVANQVPEVKNNIFWTEPGNVSVTAINSDNPTTQAVDFVNPAGILNNVFFSLASGSNTVNGVANVAIVGISGLRLSTLPAAQLYVDPAFVDKARNLVKWARTAGPAGLGLSGTDDQVITAAVAAIENQPTLTRLSLIPYVFAGFAPTTTSISTASTTGSFVGAVAVQVASSYVHVAGRFTTPIGSTIFSTIF